MWNATELMKRACLVIGIIFCLIAGGCGGDSNGGADQVANSTSALCTDLTGIEAVYWDFFNGVIRGDLPSTAFTIPFNVGGTYINSRSPLLGFTVPSGWVATDAVDVSGFAFPLSTVGADVIRNDRQSIWRYMLNAQIGGTGFSAAAILDAEINTAIATLLGPSTGTSQCEINVQQNGILGLESVAAKIVRTEAFTIMARAHVTIVNGVGPFYDAYLTLAPAAENSALIRDIFIPMITQLYAGGDDRAECEDDIDNDGDGAADYPADQQCQFPDDNTESN